MKKVFFICILIILLISFSLAIEIRYLGHSCFRLEFSSGLSIILDPYSSSTGYPIPKISADLLISSHEHADHYNPNFLEKKVDIIVGTKNNGADWNIFEKKLKDVKIWNIPYYHDEVEGKKRGKNSITVIDAEELRIVHLGDLGTILTEKEIKLIDKVDILFLPVGGYYTLSQKDALVVINQLNHKIVIPMHYKTEYTKNWPISSLDDFLSLAKKFKIVMFETSTIKISKDKLPKSTEIWVLSYK